MLVRMLRPCIPLSLAARGVVDALVLLGATYLGVAIAHATPETTAQALPLFPKALVFALVMLTVMTAFGIYKRQNQDGKRGYYVRCAVSFLAGLVLMALVFYVAPVLALGHGAFALTMALAFVGHITLRYLFLRLADHSAFKRRILVIGTSSRAAKVAKLEHGNGRGGKFHVVGFVPLNGACGGVSSSLSLRENRASLRTVATEYQIDEIVVAKRDRRYGDTPMTGLLGRRLNGTNVIDLPTFFERESGRVRLESVNPNWLIFPAGLHTGALRKMGKRVFDLAVSGLLLLITLPVLVLTALALWLESGRPILYRQQRTGAQGCTFNLLTFRNTRVGAEADAQAPWAPENDARFTLVGRVIRRLRLDELPKLVNVVQGDMSFVGPQPERPTFVQGLSTQTGYYSFRHAVKPGITGWAQVRRRCGVSVDREKLQDDLYYVRNYNLFLDLVILARTAHIVLLGRRAR